MKILNLSNENIKFKQLKYLIKIEKLKDYEIKRIIKS